jgi:hypothetical protein
MRRIRTAAFLGLLAAFAAPSVGGAQDAAPPSGSVMVVSEPATQLRLPAALYDVVGAWDLGWGDAPGRGRPGVTAAVATQTVVRGPNGSSVVRNPPAQVGQAALSKFIIGIDSVLYRRGSDWAEFAVDEITSIEETRRPENNRRGWVKVTWVARGIEQSIYFRQANASSQATLTATLRRAIELNREAALAR